MVNRRPFNPRAAVYRRLARALRRAAADLADLDLTAAGDPDTARRFGPGLAALKRELYWLHQDLGRMREGSDA